MGLLTRKGGAVLPPIGYRRSPNVSSRHETHVDLVVVHRPVGSYESAIEELCTPKVDASAHIVLGRKNLGHGRYGPLEATQLVPWSRKAWSCYPTFNPRTDNLEIEDDAWNGKDPEAWKVAARITAYRLHKRRLPPRWVRNAATDFRGGFTRHYDLGALGGGHTDPTTSTVRWLLFVGRVKWEYRRGGFRSSWGVE